MITRISSYTLSGLEVIEVDVQAQITSGMENFIIVGLADKTIGESRERVKASLASMGLALPSKKIVINLAPADLIKEGSHFDLPIAVSLLCSMEILPIEEIRNYLVAGELSLDSRILPISGILPAAIASSSHEMGLICPYSNGEEAAFSGNDGILPAKSLFDLVSHFKGEKQISPPKLPQTSTTPYFPDMSDVRGQESAKRAVEIAASGEHNLLMSGPPGSGKSMLASRMPGILPHMTAIEVLETMMVASISEQEFSLKSQRPFRSPHHSSSRAALVGGGIGRNVKPGEISLAHNGILFLDELPEFPSNVIESLRQPMENGRILISRSNFHATYPAKFQLVVAMNPCRCGYAGDVERSCKKFPNCISEYQSKISGPILDRFDITIELSYDKFYINNDEGLEGESSSEIRQRVAKTRAIQKSRFEGYNISTNARMEGKLIKDFAIPVDGSIDLLNNAAERYKLSVRSYNKILKVARTIADMEGNKQVSKIHLAEALNYRDLGFKKNG